MSEISLQQHLEKMRRQNAAQTSTAALFGTPEPDAMAEGLRIGGELGIPPSIVAGTPEPFRERLAQHRATTALTQAPRTTSWLRDPINGALAKDDLDNLTWWEKERFNTPNILGGTGIEEQPNFIRGIATGIQGMAEIGSAAATIPAALRRGSNVSILDRYETAMTLPAGASRERIAEAFGVDPDNIGVDWAINFLSSDEETRAALVNNVTRKILSDEEVISFFSDKAAEYREEAMRTRGDAPNFTSIEGVQDFVDWFTTTSGEALPFLAAFMALSAVGGTPALMAGGYATGVGDVQASLLEQGVSDRPGLAVTFGVPYALAERIGAPARLNRTGVMDRAMQSYFRRLVAEAPKTMVEEGVNEVLQEIVVDVATGIGTGEGFDLSDDNLLRYLDAFAAGAVGGLSVAPVTTAAQADADRKASAAGNAGGTAQRLARIEEMAVASKVRERSPDKFREALEAQGYQGEEVFVDAGDLQTFFQSQGQDVSPETLRTWGIDPETFEERVTAGQDVAIPLSAYATHIAGTDAAAWVAENAVSGENEMSLAQARDFRERMADDIAQAEESARAVVEGQRQMDEAEQRVFDDIYEQLRAAGQAPQVAGAQSLLFAAFFRANAERSGQEIDYLRQRFGLEIRGPATAGDAPSIQPDPVAEVAAAPEAPTVTGIVESPAPSPALTIPASGQDVAITAAGREVPVTYRVIDAGTLITSQLDDGRRNPDFPVEMQPRDRSRDTSMEQIRRIAQNLDPRLLGPNPSAADGAPIVSPDGIVESGNGRVLAIRQAYVGNPERAAAYRAYIESLGYPTEGMTMPVLVRERSGEMTDADRRAFTREANERSSMELSDTERAMADAAALPDDALALYQGGDVDLAQNRDFVRAFLTSAVSESDRGSFIDSQGRMSQRAVRRVQAALLAKAYGDVALVESVMEVTDGNIKAIGGALMDVAPMWAQMRREAANGVISPEMDQTQALLEAVNMIRRARDEGRNIQEFVGQTDIFSGEAMTQPGEGFLRLMFRDAETLKRPAGRVKVAQALGFYVDEARKAAPGMDLLGDVADPLAILATAKDRQYEDPDAQGQFFAQSPRGTGESDGAQGGIGDGRPDRGGADEARGDGAGRESTDPAPGSKEELAALTRSGATPEVIRQHPLIIEAEADMIRQRHTFTEEQMEGEGRFALLGNRTYINSDGKRFRGLFEMIPELDRISASWAGEVRQERKAVILIGPPAAGKSTIAEKMIAPQLGARILDADEVKKLIPEYNGGIGAGAVHEESSRIAKDHLAITVRRGDNIVLPKVGDNPTKMENEIRKLQAAGYSVDLVLMDVDPNEAFARMIGRFISTGRLVVPDIAIAAGRRPPITYRQLRDKGVADGYALINNNVGYNEDPIIVETRGNLAESLFGRGPVDAGTRSASGEVGAGTGPSAERRTLFQRAYHGTLAIFEKFDNAMMGSGVGDQYYGKGFYFTIKRSIAKSYAEGSAIQRGLDPDTGRILEVEIPDDEFLYSGNRLIVADGKVLPESRGLVDRLTAEIDDYDAKVQAKKAEAAQTLEEGIAELEEKYGTRDRSQYTDYERKYLEDAERGTKAETLLGNRGSLGMLVGLIEAQRGTRIYQMSDVERQEFLQSLGFKGRVEEGVEQFDDYIDEYIIWNPEDVEVINTEELSEQESRELELFQADAEFAAYREAKAEADRLLDEIKEGGDAAAAFAAFGETGRRRDDLAKAIAAEPGGIELKSDSGIFAAVTRSQADPDGWRVTFFNDTGFMGHTEQPTKLAAVQQALDEGYTTEAPGALREAMKRRSFFQKYLGQDLARGSIQFPPGGIERGTTIINLFETSDLSTFLHESGHFFLEAFAAIASDPTAPQSMRDDLTAIYQFLEADPGKPLETRHHEKWARGFETYLMEGNAPSLALADAFARFKAWLVRIYQTAIGLNVTLTPEIRDVMDRMLATEREIAEARAEQSMTPLFTEAPVGMNPRDFEAYQRMARRGQEKAEETLLRKMMAKILREKKAWYRAEKKAVREEVAREVDARPENRLIDLLGNRTIRGQDDADVPDMRIDKDTLVEQFGADVLTRLDRSSIGGKRAIYGPEGDSPAEIAEFFGFDGPGAMIEAVAAAGKRKEVIVSETERRMVERYGDPFQDGTVEEEALAAIHNEQQAATAVAEARQLARQMGRNTRNMKLKLYRQRARMMVGRMSVREVMRPGRFLAAERKAARTAQDAFGSVVRGAGGQSAIAEALFAKEQQILNGFMYDEARKVAEEVRKGREKARSYTKKSVRQKLAGGYIEQIDAILERFDFRVRSGRQVQRAESLQAFVTRMTDEGRAGELMIDDRLLDEARRTHYTRLTVDEIRGVFDTIQNLDHLGRFKERLRSMQKKRELTRSAARVAEQIATNFGTGKAKQESRLRSTFVLLWTTDTILVEMDGLDEFGPAYEEIKEAIDKGQSDEQRMFVELSEKLDDLFSVYTPAEIREMQKQRSIPGDARLWSKTQILAAALNTGNADNLQRLLADDAHPDARLTREQLDALLATLDKRDWDFVQSMWDAINDYWPQIAETEERRTGVRPKKVEATPVSTPHGDYRGGYYPIAYDPGLSQPAALDEQTAFDAFQSAGRFGKAQTADGHTKQRQKASGGRTLNLDLGVAFKHMRDVVHHLALSESVDDAYRILNHPLVYNAFQEAGRLNDHRVLNLWLKDLAHGPLYNTDVVNSLARIVKNNFTLSRLALNMKTVVLQATGLGQSAATIGKRNMLRGLLDYRKRPLQLAAEVMEKSAFMRERQSTFQKDIYDFANDVKMTSPLAGRWMRGKDAASKVGFAPIVKMQFYAVDMPTWLGAYRAGLARFNDDARAIQYADRMVARAQDSGLMGDRNAVSRGTLSETTRQSDVVRIFTTLAGYMMTKMNRANITVRRGVRDVRQAESAPQALAGAANAATDLAIMLYVFEAAVMALLYALIADDDWDEEDLQAFMLRETGSAVFGGIPFVRDAVSAFSGFGGGGVYGSVLEVPARLWTQAVQGENDPALRRAIADAVGIATGLPSTAGIRVIEQALSDEDPPMAEMLFGSNPLTRD